MAAEETSGDRLEPVAAGTSENWLLRDLLRHHFFFIVFFMEFGLLGEV